MLSPDTLRDILSTAAADAFGDLGFLLVEPDVPPGDASQTAVPDDTPVATAQIALHGTVAGSLMVQVTGGVLEALATNMLALDSAPDEPTQRDALGELVNVLVGRVVADLEFVGFEMHMGLPEVSGGNTAVAVEPAVAQVRLKFLEGFADVALVWHEGHGP